MTARVRLSLVLRLIRATPALPPAVAWFLWRALCVAIVSGDTFSLRSAAEPRQLAILLRVAQGRRRVAELGTATGWTAAAIALADPARVVVSCDPNIQPGRDRYLRLLRSSTRARIELVHVTGVEAAATGTHEVDLLFIDSSHERQATIDEWHAWQPRLAADALVVFHDCDHPEFPGIARAIEDLGLRGVRQAGMFVWHSTTRSPPHDDAQQLADEAQGGYDVDALVARRGKRGRPSLGSAPASVESVRLDPELRDQLAARAKADGMTASEIIRQALRDYLHK